MPPKVAIIYLSFHCEPYIDDVVSALKKITYPKDRLAFIIVDNPHPDYGSSVRYLQENILPMSGKDLPQTVILPQEKNLGFAAGNNAGVKWALENGFDYVYFHNNDGFLTSGAIEPLVKIMEGNREVGVVQSLMLMYPETELVNSAGNSYNYLGVAFCGNFRFKRGALNLKAGEEIGYASGAAMLARCELLKHYGNWDEDFFLYHEDLEYSLRLRSVGYKIVLAPDSIFYHKYNFSRNKDKFYYIERNRWGLMLMYYKWQTLLLLFPIGLALEIGMMIFAYRDGWIKEKISAYKYWFNIKNYKFWLAKRRHIQGVRMTTDKFLLSRAVATVNFNEKSIDNPILKFVGNPLMAAYWWVAKIIIVW